MDTKAAESATVVRCTSRLSWSVGSPSLRVCLRAQLLRFNGQKVRSVAHLHQMVDAWYAAKRGASLLHRNPLATSRSFSLLLAAMVRADDPCRFVPRLCARSTEPYLRFELDEDEIVTLDRRASAASSEAILKQARHGFPPAPAPGCSLSA
jgi:hypothetical protein